jgi:hypothetical protein
MDWEKLPVAVTCRVPDSAEKDYLLRILQFAAFFFKA